MNNFLLIIPARLKSTRLPNKLLLKIKGKEILKYVWERCKKACKANDILIATPDQKIINFCKNNKINFFKTSSKCLTGTDRIIEISKKIKKDFYINVQGDEIFVSPESIKKVINLTKFYNKKYVINAFTKIKKEEDFRSSSVPKIVTDSKQFLLYISRAPLPTDKKKKFNQKNTYKQVCIYSYPRNLLSKIKYNKKSVLEKIEDIEILRFLENGIKVKMVRAQGSKLAIDTKSDFLKAQKIL